MKKKAKSTFEKIIIFKKNPYWIYWPLIGVIGFVFSEWLFRHFKEQPYYIGRFIAAFSFATIPTLNIWLYNSFVSLLRKVSDTLWPTASNDEAGWMGEVDQKVFTLKYPISRFITSMIVVSGIITVFALGLPFSSTVPNIIGILAFTILLWFCGQTMYISFALLSALREITKHPVKIPFMLIPHPTISNLQSFYSSASLAITFLYSLLVVAIWQGPYGLHTFLLVWLTLLAFYPGSMWLWSFTQIHKLQQTIKQSQVQIINEEVQKALRSIMNDKSSDSVEQLDRLIKIQLEVQKIREWPIALSSVLTFIITILAATTQIIVSFKEIFTQ